MNFLWYVVLSTLEASASFIILLHLFRYDASQYLKPIIIVGVLFSLLSFALRVELDFNDYFPIVSFVTFILFAFYVLKVPLLWAVIISILGNTATFIFQTLIMIPFVLTGTISFNDYNVSDSLARIMQVVYAGIVIPLSYFLYKRGIGFAFNFDKLRWRLENVVVLFVVALLMMVLLFTFIKNEVYYFTIVDLLCLALLLYMALRKEQADRD